MSPNPYKTIELDRRGPAMWIRFNRVKVHNAMNRQCLIDCTRALDEIAADGTIRVVVFAGNGGKAFTAGADISELANMTPFGMLDYNRNWLDLFARIENLRKPVIACVQGWATGGGTELSLCCDFVICSDDARFGLTEVNLGVIPGAGAAVRLTRWMGRLKAKELLMLGDRISGREAVAIGLANKSVPVDRLEAEATALADTLAKKAPLALAAAKTSVNVAAESSMSVALELELREFLLLFGSDDQKEGMRAFLEKRAPQFQGK